MIKGIIVTLLIQSDRGKNLKTKKNIRWRCWNCGAGDETRSEDEEMKINSHVISCLPSPVIRTQKRLAGPSTRN